MKRALLWVAAVAACLAGTAPPLGDADAEPAASPPKPRATATKPAAAPAGVTYLRGHESGIWHLALSHDGARIASASYDGTVRLWNRASGALLATHQVYRNIADGVLWSSDNTRLVAFSRSSDGRDRDVKVVTVATGEIHAVPTGGATIRDVALARTDVLAVVPLDGNVELRALDGSTLATLETPATAVAFSPDGTKLAVGAFDLVVYDVRDAAAPRELGRIPKTFADALRWSADGSRLAAVASAPGPDSAYVFAIGDTVTVAHHLSPLDVLAPKVDLSADGTVLIASMNGLHVWHPARKTSLSAPPKLMTNKPRTAAFHPDGKLFVECVSGAVRLWSRDAIRHVTVLTPAKRQVGCGHALFPDAHTLLATVGNDIAIISLSRPDLTSLAAPTRR